MKRLLLLLIVLLVPSVAWAEDLYVAQNVAGSADGSSCANAFNPLFFNTLANWGISTGRINPGDTVHLCGTITTQLAAKGNGSTGLPITIIFEPNAKLSQPLCPYSAGCLSIASRSYIVVDGGTNGIIESTNNGSPSGGYVNSTNSLGVYAQPCNNCEIKNLTIQNIYVHTDPTDGVIDFSLISALLLGGSNTTVHHNTFRMAGACITHFWANAESNISIYNNEMDRCSHGVAVAGAGTVPVGSFSTWKFYNNHYHDPAIWDNPGVNRYHHNMVHAYGISTTPGDAVGDNYNIYNNLADGDCGTLATSGGIYMESGSSEWTVNGTVRIYNNVIKCTTHAVNGLLQASGGNVQVYNNTISGYMDAGGALGGFCLRVFAAAHTKIRNNAISGCQLLLDLSGVVTFDTIATDLNNNSYGLCNANTQCFNWVGIAPFRPFGTWQTQCACDGNSQKVTNLVIDATGAPTAGSPLINTGSNLTFVGLTALNSDKNGIPRPLATSWETGAYEFGGQPMVSYPLVPGLSLSSTYSMTVDGVNVPVQRYGGHSFAWFAFSGTATVVVTVNAPVSTYTLSPLRNATPSTKSGATVNFSLSAPKHLVLHKVNAIAEKLFILGDAFETNPPDASDTGIFNIVTGYGADNTGAVVATTAIQNAINAATAFGAGSVVYVPAGLYTVNAAEILKANIHFYLAPGAVIKNIPGIYSTNVAYHVNGQSNVRVSGRGVLYGVGTTNTSFTFLFEVGATSGTVNNFTMQDVMLLDSRSTALRIGNITNSTVTNVKILSAAPGLSDGIDADGLTNVLVDHVFILSSDDSFAVMTGQSSFSYTIPSNTDGYTVKNSLMYHTSTGHSLSIFSFHVLQYMKNILFENNDTISTNDGFAMLASNGPIDINHVTIRNCRLEEVRRLAVEMYSVDFSVGWGGAANGFWSSDSGKINNIIFDNVIFDTAGPVFGQLVGRSATQNIDTINFNSVYMNGILATNAATTHISIGPFVTNVTWTNTVLPTDVLPPAAPTNIMVQ